MEPAVSAHSLTPSGVSPVPQARERVAVTAAARPLQEGPGLRARAEARSGLYLHVPFCATRCSYCDFSAGAASRSAVTRYLDAIEREMALRAPQAEGAVFHSVFFGGGTPSALSARHFAQIGRAMRSHFTIATDAEITLEANPESVRPALLEAWRTAGVNRLSMGAQSFVAEELALLGRIHAAGRPADAIRAARDHGIERISLDLMFGFPGHSLDRWRCTVEQALSLEPEHLSAYAFIPEPGTPLGNRVLRREAQVSDDELQAELYEALHDWSAPHGFGSYETSNLSQPDAEARHNLVYWLRRPYLALGPAAHGHWQGERYGNHYALERWAAAVSRGERPQADGEMETAASRASEMLMLGLRLTTGLDRRDYAATDWSDFEQRYGSALASGAALGRIERTVHGWRVSAAHRFIADDIAAWLEARAEDGLTGAASAS